MWSHTWSRCAGLLSSDLGPFGARKAGSVLPNCSFRATSAWRSTSCIWRGPAFGHLKCCVTSFENPLTSVMRNGFFTWWAAVQSWSYRNVCWSFQPAYQQGQQKRTHLPEPVPSLLGSVHSLLVGTLQVSSESSVIGSQIGSSLQLQIQFIQVWSDINQKGHNIHVSHH